MTPAYAPIPPYAAIDSTTLCAIILVNEREVNLKCRSVDILLQPVAALIAGILILIKPKLLNYIVAVYLILIGILGLSH
jgi:hypothetical protein